MKNHNDQEYFLRFFLKKGQKMLHKYINFLIALCLAAAFTACAAGGSVGVDKPAAPNLVNQENDQEEYELIIIDPGFNTWFMTNARPMGFYQHSYYQHWNRQYVAAWNEKVNQQIYYNHRNYPFENRIDYDPHVDYGVELDYQLFWYFRYVQSLYGRMYNFPGFSARHM
jgi:hypothetical protein